MTEQGAALAGEDFAWAGQKFLAGELGLGKSADLVHSGHPPVAWKPGKMWLRGHTLGLMSQVWPESPKKAATAMAFNLSLCLSRVEFWP
jgi:hypothetical protein